MKDLERCLQKDSKYTVAYSVQGSIYMNLKERDNAIKAFRLYLERGHPDTADFINSLYSLSILMHEKNKKSEARKYYNKAKDAEERFKKLYGTKTGMSDNKRRAIQLHESPEDARNIIFQSMPSKQYNNKIEQLIQAGILNSPYPPSSSNCSNCGAKHLKDQPDKPLLCCGGCKSIWYCCRECQVKDYKAGHKIACKKAAKHWTFDIVPIFWSIAIPPIHDFPQFVSLLTMLKVYNFNDAGILRCVYKLFLLIDSVGVHGIAQVVHHF